MLRKKSDTWQSIVSDMESRGKVGESLSIHCNNHPRFQEKAKFPGDFAKYFPTGGCHLPCEFLLKCGHVCGLTCHSSDPEHEQYQCTRPVSETCPEGHTINRLCYEESKCTTVVERTMPDCGHLMKMPCHEDLYKFPCKEMCSKIMPECGHSQEMICCKDPDRFLCRNKCEALCPNGHACPLLCYQGCRPCKVQSEVQLPLCGHMQIKYCHQDITDIKCNTPCEKVCMSGHPCRLSCYQDCGHCKVRVHKVFTCEHTTNVRCSEELLAKCSKPCLKKLSCGHECPLTCGETCADVLCLESIEITLPKCKHKAYIPCHEKKDHLYRWKLNCTSHCEKKLACGHNCAGICGDPCIQKCEVGGIRRKCQAGHQLIRRCFQTLDNYPCDMPCTKKLSCGHPCQNLCSESCTLECKFLVIKKYPCGHQHKISCLSPIEDHPCDIFCRAPLACGHTCKGKCSDCRSTRIHKPCSHIVSQPHFCGETIPMKCIGLQDGHGKVGMVAEPKMKVLTCMHTEKPYECGKEVYKCTEPCQWSCQHHECTQLCHELCDRQPCNSRCLRFLECGHLCVGLCGEPCINVCPVCDQENFCALAGEFSAQKTYTQLLCGHIYTVEDMDRCVSERPSCDIGPLQCPECSSLLSFSCRYGNAAKKALSHVEAVKAKVQSLTTQLIMSAEDRSRLSQVISHSFSNFSETKFGHSDVYSKPMRCMRDFKQKLSRHQKVIYKEAGFIVFLLSKVFTFALNIGESTPITAYQQMMNLLVSMDKPGQNLSYQVFQDLLSELYCLCFQAKLTFCQQHFLGSSVLEKEQVFLSGYDHPSYRMLKKDFTSHSKMLDIISRHFSTFESTDEFFKDVDCFQPSIFSGRWQKCVLHHYYCIPVCNPGTVDMKCPECTGSYAVSVRSVKTSRTAEMDISEQLSEIVGIMKSTKKKTHNRESGDAAKHGKKRKKKKRRT